jgi:hypothetical protein
MSLIVSSNAWYLIPRTRSALDPSITLSFLRSSGPVPGVPTGTFLRSGNDRWRTCGSASQVNAAYINNVLSSKRSGAGDETLPACLGHGQGLDVSLGD